MKGKDMEEETFNLERVKKRLECNEPAEDEYAYTIDDYRKAGVLVPLVCEDGEWHLLFTRRSDTLKNHRGQVSFPGGGMEAGDLNVKETAIREAEEEIGIKKEDINIFGCMPEMLTVSNFVVTPVLAVLRWPVEIVISRDEVSRVFTIPVKWLRDKENWEERPFTHPSGWHGSVIFFKPYDGELLWGISAKITVELLEMIFK